MRLTIAAKRVIICAAIVIQVAGLVIQAVEVRVIHHSAAATFFGVILPAVGILCGLNYLRSTRGQS